ncbi:MAG: hypothetical protein CL441_09605 [Acidimicrobiaceae bacterium]|nr:hypothetical protein [Acidimicrobiaceae bacterium]
MAAAPAGRGSRSLRDLPVGPRGDADCRTRSHAGPAGPRTRRPRHPGTRGVLATGAVGRDDRGVPLTERDRAILDFERSWWTLDVPKEGLINERFELSVTRYYQLLAELLESPDAFEYDPLVVRRLRRQRDRRRRARFEAPVREEDGRS